MMRLDGTPIEQTDTLREALRASFGDTLKVTLEFSTSRDKGYYGVCFVSPSRSVRNALSVDRELLVLISTFTDQQARTIQTARDLIQESDGRLDSSTFIVVHRDPRGNAKLKKWGREKSLAVLPLFADAGLPSHNELLNALAHELFSYDVFDVTGPVADDSQFYGRREEARELARKLQTSQIRACFGILKIGKTSIIHRVIREVTSQYDCTTYLIDAQSDPIFELDAARLMNSLACSLENSEDRHDYGIIIVRGHVEMSVAAERLRAAVCSHYRQVLFVFDEVDYLTPTSPTAPHWREEFNKFWRNLRAIYQSVAVSSGNLSILVSGVSSKWFSEESIDGIENAALSFVPEEYLSPLPRGAASAMIRRLGKTVGLIFSDSVADYVAETCADMPFWIRKACSYIHNRIEIGLRPFEPERTLIVGFVGEFVASDGVAMSEVALQHLFRVYPELRVPTQACASGRAQEVPRRLLRTLEKYGIVKLAPQPMISGQMITTGLANLTVSPEAASAAPLPLGLADGSPDYGDWADELAIISRSRNVLERKLREVIVNFVRSSSLSSGASAKDRILKCVNSTRRAELQSLGLDTLMQRLYWLELMSIVKKEWGLFEKIFGDSVNLHNNASVVNERPDAHAKELDAADLAHHRRAIAWFEDRLTRLD